MKKRVVAALLALSFLVMTATTMAQSNAKVNALVAKGSPLKIFNATVTTSNGQSTITYSIQNTSDRVINNYLILALVFDANGNTQAGEKHLVRDSLRPKQRRDTAFIYHGGWVSAHKNYVLSPNNVLTALVVEATG